MKRSLLLTLALSLATLQAQTNLPVVVTAYCHCAKCRGRSGQPTASGKMPVEGITVAGPRKYPLGTRVYIEGIGERTIQDRLARRFDDRM
jgi:3D (Asp-Asp-Asp) domain-containing protein